MPEMTIQEAMDVAVAHHQEGRFQQAESIYRQVLARHPDHSDALHLLGALAYQIGKADLAIELIGRAIAIFPDAPQYYSNLGQALAAVGRSDEAMAAYRRALSIHPTYADAHFHLGNALQSAGRLDEAIASFRRAIELRPDLPDAHYNLGNALQTRGGQIDEAIAGYRQALELRPQFPQALTNLANLLHANGRYEQAIAEYRKALAIAPDMASAHHNLGLTLLLLGQFGEGLPEYEWRGDGTLLGRFWTDFDPKLKWSGADLQDRTILLYTEQGFGDAMQFVRYARKVAERNPHAKLIIRCQPAMVRLFQLSVGDMARIVAKTEPLPAFDAHCPLMSLPLILGTTPATVPSDVPYLKADADHSARWRLKMSDDSFKVGLQWMGRPIPNPKRSMPLETLAPLTQVSNVRFYSLQKYSEEKPTTVSDQMQSMGITNWADELGDFAETAALIDNLDLVITIDTAVAHLAGAMGKPVWVLLPFVPDWRWLLDRMDSPWYPTMRLFRQPEPEDWRSPIHRIVEELPNEVRRCRK